MITAASILAVGVAGAFAIGANIGILDAAGKNNVGNLSAAGDLTFTDPLTTDASAGASAGDPANASTTDPATTTADVAAPAADIAAPAGSARDFLIDTAGSITLETTADGLRLDAVTPNTGWSWSLVRADPSQIDLVFTDSGRRLRVTATVGSDGQIAVDVTEPQALVVSPTGPAQSAPTSQVSDQYDHHEGSGDDD